LAQTIVEDVRQRLTIDPQQKITGLQSQFCGDTARFDSVDAMTFRPFHDRSSDYIIRLLFALSTQKAASMKSSPLHQ
jgi:hypothetical protein